MAFRERQPIKLIDCTGLEPGAVIEVSDEEREGIVFGGTELVGGYLDYDASVIRRIPTQAARTA